MNTTDRLIEAWQEATPTALGQRRWYWAMNDFARGLGERYSVPITRAADVIAVISPRLSVEKNMAYAELLFATGDAPIMGAPKRAALRIVHEGIGIVEATKDAPKIVSFAHNIAFPDTSRAVTIDRHIIDFLTGSVDDGGRRVINRAGRACAEHKPLNSWPTCQACEPSAYVEAAAEFRAAADKLGIMPHELQAVVWFIQKTGKVYAKPQHATLYQASGRIA